MPTVKELREKHRADSVQVRFHGGVVFLKDSPLVYRGSGAQYLSPQALMMHAYGVLENAETVARVETRSTKESRLPFQKSVIKKLLKKFIADEVVVSFAEASVHFKEDGSINVKEAGLFVVRNDLIMRAKKIAIHPDTEWRGVVVTKEVHSELTKDMQHCA